MGPRSQGRRATRGPTAGERIAACLESLVSLLARGALRPRWATVCEAERYARARNGTIAEAIARGELPSYRRGPRSSVLVDLDEVDGWIHETWRVDARETGGGDRA